MFCFQDGGERPQVNAAGGDGTEALRCDVGQDFAFGKVAGEGKGGGDGGVEVRARDVPGGVNHCHDDEAKGCCDAHVGDGAFG